MAAKEASKSGRYKLTFPEKVLGDPIIHRVSHDFNVAPNIMRGRISEKNAWLEVELAGTAKNLEKALKYLAAQGISIQKLD